jgi:hypothetical protein
MLVQQAIDISLSISFYQLTRYFQFINISEKLDRAFVLLPKFFIEKLPLISTDICCKSLIEKDITLDSLCFAEFMANYNTKTCKIRKCVKVIHWVCFNVHKDHENHYKELLLLFKPFHESKIDLKKCHDFWKDAYLNEKDNIEKIKKKNCTTFMLKIKVMMNGTIYNQN